MRLRKEKNGKRLNKEKRSGKKEEEEVQEKIKTREGRISATNAK